MSDGRFAPSPSGPLHVGNLRTALLAWLFARHAGSRFLIRIEDLDPVSSRDEWVTAHLDDLAALGLTHDGGVVRQSAPDRRAAHDAAVDELVRRDLVYPCFCTRKEVAAAAEAPHDHLPEGAYPGTCASLSTGHRTERAATRTPAWRVRAHAAARSFTDRLRGPTEGVVDDFVVRRADGVPAYNLAVVVDDAWQSIGEVVRGDDLLAGTPRQIWLAEQLGLPPVRYAHVPLVLGRDGERLAKRHGAVTLDDLRAHGWSVTGLLGVLGASLGLCERADPVDATTLLERFDPGAVPPDPVVFDPSV